MTKEEFYGHIANITGRPLTERQALRLDCGCEPEDLEGTMRGIDGGWIKSLRGKVPEFIPIHNAPARLAEGTIGWWLYDRKSATWIINMNRGTHELMAGALYDVYSDEPSDWINLDALAEKYIDEGYGCFVSGSMNMYIPIKDDSFILTEHEQVLDRAKGSLKWRGIR